MAVGQNSRSDSPEVLQRLLDEARKLFARQGYAHTTVRDIVASAQVSNGGFYHYFAGKESLLFAIMDRFIDEQLQTVEEIVNSDEPEATKIRRVIEHLVQQTTVERDALRIAMREVDSLRPADRAIIIAKEDAWRLHLISVVESGRRKGVFEIEGSDNAITGAIVGMCHWVTEWFYKREKLGVTNQEDLVEVISHLALKGLERR
jgi:AcrR family transcriptional regulator